MQEKPTTELRQMSYKDYCDYLFRMENTSYEDYSNGFCGDLDDVCDKYFLYGDVCMETCKDSCKELLEYFSSIPDCGDSMKFRKMLQYWSNHGYIPSDPVDVYFETLKGPMDKDVFYFDENLLKYLKEAPSSIHHPIKKFLYIRTQDENWFYHHYDNVHYAKKFSTTALVDLQLSDLTPETCEKK